MIEDISGNSFTIELVALGEQEMKQRGDRMQWDGNWEMTAAIYKYGETSEGPTLSRTMT